MTELLRDLSVVAGAAIAGILAAAVLIELFRSGR